MQQTCDSELVEIINGNLPEGVRPVSSLTAPGEINRGVVAILAEYAPMEKVGKMVAEMLEATRMTKHGEVPDWRAREAAGKLILAYREGLPVQRVETKNENVNTDNDALMRVLASPAALRSVKNLLAQAEAAETVSEKQA